MRVLVTGGAGFIGSHIVDALLGSGHQVLVLDDLSTGHRSNVPDGADLLTIDIRDANAVGEAFRAFKPDVVSHQAAQTSVAISTREPARDASINLVGLIHVLNECVALRVQRIVFASSGGTVYGDVEAPRKAAVGDPVCPLSPYGTSKLAGEYYLGTYRHEFGLEYTCLRYANVYGPRQDPHGEAGVIAIFAQRLIRREPIRVNAMAETGDSGCIRDYVFVGDVVRANLAALQGQIDLDILNVCTGTESTTLDVARGLEATVGVKADLGFGPRRAGDLRRSVLADGPMVQRLGANVPLAEGLDRTARWFLAAPSRS